MQHKPVMVEEALRQLALKPGGVYVDATFGRGGHSLAILARLGGQGRLLALDRDGEAIASATAGQLRQDPRFTLRQASFGRLAELVGQEGLVGQVDGVLLDLGVSSPQLDSAGRGFSFLRDGPLDMRMDTSGGQTAADWLATVDERQLAQVLFGYGEERCARRIARAIVAARARGPITGTQQLAGIVAAATPNKDPHKHPATRSFQALRIVVNDELGQLEAVLPQALAVLRPGGRLVAIAFHSLEDRIVKRFINDETGARYDPGRLPVRQQDIPKGRLKKIGKALKACALELQHNPRARSAVMRVAEKV